ncbi:nucleotidyltransferase domain-containing protein [Campylobacter sp. RM16192]|uniref:nucleotidyltransferase domain-containing protein n=1 Tax=Campylobacter sp. RM16192 TaxID=1660080 RepID=UPI001452726C|nr:nucleotidyltransferase domain-containing protein [Campylobacter sp. RM16192]QCD52672.1 nucleotidyl transferase domain protein [Campylobacter sp. RM16192]
MTDILLAPKYIERLKTIFKTLCPSVSVLAYGSRIKTNSHDGSDLDLAIISEQNINIAKIKTAISDSNIPFLVDILSFNILPQNFKDEILKQNVVIYQGEK